MDHDNNKQAQLKVKKRVTFRLFDVSGYTTEVMEIQSDNPTFQVLVIHGDPGVVNFYKDFVHALYELLGGTASVTAVSHIAHNSKDWGELGRLFSLQEQIIHKIDFIKQELQNNAPLLLVGHSIGAYISMEMFKMAPEKVTYFVGLYPFLALNLQSRKQASIGKIAESHFLCVALSFLIAVFGLLPRSLLRLVVLTLIGNSGAATAVEAASHLLKYHTMMNVIYMAKTEFQKLSEVPDWAFMRKYQHKIAFLFGSDDHWGRLHMLEEIGKQVPDAALSIEREGYNHTFFLTEAGSLWVAEHVAILIKNKASL